jgi:acetolactate synthase small subunit
MISTAADASALSRVLELFALRGMVPDEVTCKRTGVDELHIHIAVRDLGENKAANLAARMRNIIPVMRVVLEPASHA